MSEIEQPIHRIFGDYQAAVYARNVNDFAGLYDPDVCVFELWVQWSYRGITA